ncbi:MAG: zf-HC2 domain-containing protein [Actinomycetota bacterium]
MMDCDGVRRTLSAALDDEAGASELEVAREHVKGCRGCRVWIEDLHEMNRALRIQEVSVPDLTVSILTEWDRQKAGRTPSRLVRVGLAVVGVVNLLLAALRLADVQIYFLGPVEHHSGRELAAFSAALAAGFLLSAWDGRARGRLGVVGTAILLLVLTAATDVASSRADLLYELAGHLPNVFGFGLLLLVHRFEPFTPSSRPRLRRHPQPGIREAA